MAPVSSTNILQVDDAISWRAVAAGAAAAMALTLLLLAIGSAVGFSSVSPWANAGVSATTFEIGSGIYLVVMAMISSTLGGYIAGRLRSKWTGVYNYEVQFRDTAHGFLAWAVATILGAAFLATTSTFLAGGVATGASAGATVGAQSNNASAYTVAQLFRPAAGRPADSSAAAAAAAPASASAAANGGASNAGGAGASNANRQAVVILTHSAANGGTVSDSDRTYLAQLVSAETGASQADAEKRVDEVLTQAKAQADRARKAAASLSIWIAISMLVGAFSAALAAIEGGQLRDRRWRGVFGTRAYTEARIDN